MGGTGEGWRGGAGGGVHCLAARFFFFSRPLDGRAGGRGGTSRRAASRPLPRSRGGRPGAWRWPTGGVFSLPPPNRAADTRTGRRRMEGKRAVCATPPRLIPPSPCSAQPATRMRRHTQRRPDHDR